MNNYQKARHSSNKEIVIVAENNQSATGDLYEFNKQDAFERHEILNYLRRKKLVEFTEKRIITNYYKLGQYGKDVVNGNEKLFY